MSKKVDAILGKRVRMAREKMGLSQLELARKLGYKSGSTIARIENGDNDLTQTKLVKFAAALNVTPGFLLGDALEVTLTSDTHRQVTPPDGARLAAILRQLQTNINAAFDRAIYEALNGDGYTSTGNWSLDRQAVEKGSNNSGTA